MTLDISTDKSRLDIAWIHRFLSEESYWAARVPLEIVRRAVEHSLCFGLYVDGHQVGFARVVTDRATFAWVSDVFVDADHRGRGYGKRLMEAIGAHPDLQDLRLWILGTRDAHGLYEQYGFGPATPGRFMERRDVISYLAPEQP
jgi:GNAT superfamily N-acetyltransferase